MGHSIVVVSNLISPKAFHILEDDRNISFSDSNFWQDVTFTYEIVEAAIRLLCLNPLRIIHP